MLVPEAIWPIEGFNVPETDHVPAFLVLASLAAAIALLAALHVTLGRPTDATE